MFKEITIIGLGFMGASLAGALKSLKPDIFINGLDVNQKNIDFCFKNNFIDRAVLLNNIPSAYNPKQSDITVLCIPPKIILNFLSVHKNFLSQFQLITDIGSIKKEIVSTAKSIGLNNFAGSHPMCGSDKSGAENADINMFHGKTCIVIRENNLNKNSNDDDIRNNNASNNFSDLETKINNYNYCDLNFIEKITLFWEALGMEIVYADACFHDYMVGYSSHLPHIVSFCLSKTVLDAADANQTLNSLKYIASGFKDTTRIAASSENIWTDIFLLNADNLISSLDNYINNLNKFRVLLKNSDENALSTLIAEISKQRKMLN
ncbi:MAG: prephenate dehydrogenase/arogenate dehydrogenase family protein [Candidatus Acididesulfobacter guangdongensis]|uniref:Prephenate dehydrogenase/arogenate dehydrogenase family protein n=1 Tax=Acididesulfobacter guangdongensis TaxID=2597225 RepID=A0A519BF84_ACIG2|nr:MAG: prephenate dehydrogenase/arogenate dehydrogenase family protein [Candidatus Acididesulfobacter guangdongensis]